MAVKRADILDEAIPRELAAVLLYALAAAALVGTCATFALQKPSVLRRYAHSPPVDTRTLAPWPTALKRVAEREKLLATPNVSIRPLSESLLVAAGELSADQIRSDLAGLLQPSSDYLPSTAMAGEYVRRPAPGPIVEPYGAHNPLAAICFPVESSVRHLTQSATNNAMSLAIVAPSSPRVTAGMKHVAKIPRGQLYAFELRESAASLGRWWVGKPQWISVAKASKWMPKFRVAREQKVVQPLSTPLNRKAYHQPRIVVSPGDRLAMVPTHRRQQEPRLEIRRRDQEGLVLVIPPQPDASPKASAESVRGQVKMELAAVLNPLARSQITAEWAQRVRGAAAGASLTESSLDQLAKLATEGRQIADSLDQTELAPKLRRATLAIQRRLASWRVAGKMEVQGLLVSPKAVATGDQRLRAKLAEVAAATAEADRLAANRGEAWRQYLMVDRLQRTLDNPMAHSTAADRQLLASEIVSRLSTATLSAPQREYVVSGPIAELGDELAEWAAPPVDARSVLTAIEQYERDPSPRRATRIARDVRQLAQSPTALHRNFANRVEQQYRNANLRVAITAEMLERYLPPATNRVDPVRDTIAGEFVQGRAATNTKLSLRLMTDPKTWRIGLEARGQVNSRTFSNPGPIVMQNRGATNFVGRKMIAVGKNGLQVSSASCDVSSRMRLTGMQSYYDDVPLLGSFIRSQAADEYAARRRIAKRQSDERVRVQVRRQFDRQAAPLIAKLEQDFTTKVLSRSSQLGLSVDPVELRTTEERLVARLRVANRRQLAAHTPRNRAPSDSLVSVQLHQSLLNNGAEGLQLSGRRFTPLQLRQAVQQKLQLELRQNQAARDPAAEDATLVFAAEEPIRIILEKGQAELILSLAEFTLDKKRFRNFKVHAFYRPEADGIEARMVRTGGVQIEGRMRTGARIRLHGVFGQVLAEDRPIELLKLPAAGEPRVAGLMITQLVIGDGWLGLAIGPETDQKRVATVGSYVR